MTYCDNCEASLSETDYECGRCTQCGHQITTEETKTMTNEWSGMCDPCDPANYWVDDETGERVSAATGERSRHDCPMMNADGSVKEDRKILVVDLTLDE